MDKADEGPVCLRAGAEISRFASSAWGDIWPKGPLGWATALSPEGYLCVSPGGPGARRGLRVGGSIDGGDRRLGAEKTSAISLCVPGTCRKALCLQGFLATDSAADDSIGDGMRGLDGVGLLVPGRGRVRWGPQVWRPGSSSWQHRLGQPGRPGQPLDWVSLSTAWVFLSLSLSDLRPSPSSLPPCAPLHPGGLASGPQRGS